jgi:hypothetical protein
MFLKYVLSQGLGELAAGHDSRNEPQSNALLRTTLRYLARAREPAEAVIECQVYAHG